MERREVLEHCEVRGKTILDVGAGPLACIAASDFGCTVISLDVDRSSLLKEWENLESPELLDRIHFEQADASALPHPDGSVDLVISYGALHHCPLSLREMFVKECFRVSRKRLCIVEYRPATFPHEEDFTPVDLEWLGSILGGMGILQIFAGEEIDIYSCIK